MDWEANLKYIFFKCNSCLDPDAEDQDTLGRVVLSHATVVLAKEILQAVVPMGLGGKVNKFGVSSPNIFPTRCGQACILPNRPPRREDDNPEVNKWLATLVPLLVEALALLLDAGLNPGHDIITELGQGLVPRSGEAAVVLWRV